jgi:hypothetical protein
MKKISAFDLGMIIAFVVVALLGGGAWWYLSGQLDATKADVGAADSDFQKYSSREVYLPTAQNQKTLQSDIDLMQAQLDPLIHTHLQAPDNKLSTVIKEDTVAWKHDLDAEASRLNNAARLHGVNVPANFYYGFSRYLNRNPTEEQTAVLSKQLLGVEQLATIFINAPVKTISTFRRTFEEDSSPVAMPGPGGKDPDLLPGSAQVAPGDVYTAYPFEIEFEATTEAFRKIVNDLGKSPYVFVIRSLTIQNSAPASPQISDLDALAGAAPSAVTDTAPGAVAATTSNSSNSGKGPQFLFGNETLHIKARIDMIEWHGTANPATTPPAGARPHRRGAGAGAAGSSPGGNP